LSDQQIEYWVDLIRELVDQPGDTRSNRTKLNDALDLQTQINERIETMKFDESYIMDIISRVNSLIDSLKKHPD
jgi:hypothetical protein